MNKENPSVLFAKNVVNTKYESFDNWSIERAKQRLVDSIGLFCVGAHASGVKSTVEMLKGWGGNPDSTVYNYGVKMPSHYAAFVNSIQLRS